uniref:Uncharacterized protein n=1 Tax=Acanthochromis polyacanthus TaxID=80966 RepID=A0A3Q1I2C7_9TELE
VVKEGLLLCIEVLNRQKVFRADSTRVALPISAVGLVNVGQQSALVTEGLMAVDALQGALGVALCDVPLELFRNIKAFLTTAAFTGFFQLPFISSGEA